MTIAMVTRLAWDKSYDDIAWMHQKGWLSRMLVRLMLVTTLKKQIFNTGEFPFLSLFLTTMENSEGQRVDLYIPRKWLVSLFLALSTLRNIELHCLYIS